MNEKKRSFFLSALFLFLLLQSAGAYAGEERTAHARPVSRMLRETAPVRVLVDRAFSDALLSDLQQAKHSIIIVMYLFKISGRRSALPDRIADVLREKHKQGLGITVILNMDRKRAGYETADSVDQTNLATAKRLKDKGIEVDFDSSRVITHAKVIIIDGKIVYIGSHNLTQSALRYNHEVSVRIVSPAVARELTDYMEVVKHER